MRKEIVTDENGTSSESFWLYNLLMHILLIVLDSYSSEDRIILLNKHLFINISSHHDTYTRWNLYFHHWQNGHLLFLCINEGPETHKISYSFHLSFFMEAKSIENSSKWTLFMSSIVEEYLRSMTYLVCWGKWTIHTNMQESSFIGRFLYNSKSFY